MNWRSPIFLTIVGLFAVLLIGSGVYLGLADRASHPPAPPSLSLSPTASQLPTHTITQSSSPQSAISRPTMAPPLAHVSFPTQVASYPPDWPPILHYPASFTLSQTSSQAIANGAKIWAAKLRFHGDAKTTADSLASFFTTQGWSVVQRTQLDSGGFVILVRQNNSKNQGDLVVDPDTTASGYTKIVATVTLF